MKYYALIFLFLCFTATVSFADQAENGQSLLVKAKALLERDIDKAEEVIENALVQSPNDPEVNFLCGRIMGRQAEDAFFSALSYAKKSLACLQRAVELAPAEHRYRFGLLSFYLGAPSIAGGDETLGWKQVEAITELDPLQGAKAEVKYLQSTEQNGKLKSTLISMRQRYPADAEMHFRFGLLMQEERKYQQAFEAFKAATDTQDKSTYFLNALYQLGRNAVFSEIHIQEGVKGLLSFVEQYDKSKNTPPIEWAYLRLAQLYNLMQDEAKQLHYATLARQSDERELHRALKQLINKES